MVNNKAKAKSQSSGKDFLKESFSLENELLFAKLNFSSETITHSGVLGATNENHFTDYLRRYLPSRYQVDTGIVIDSNGSTSDQIDVVIFDRHYTPTLLDQKCHRYIPCESVYAIIEVKPCINKEYLDYASRKAESVRKLIRTSLPIPHAGGEYPAKAPFQIISGIVAPKSEWVKGFESKSFRTAHNSLLHPLEFGVAINTGAFDCFEHKMRLYQGITGTTNLMFRLLSKLQSYGTAPAINWNSYARIFS